MIFSVWTHHGDHRSPGDDPLLLQPAPCAGNLIEGILLTSAGSQTSVEVSALDRTMKPSRQFAAKPLRVWKAVICVLLALLFLYNPFASAVSASGGLTVCHPASYRGTVACSELERYPRPNIRVAALLPIAAEIQRLIPSLITAAPRVSRSVEDEAVATPQTGFSSSLWFRPPPAV